MIVEFLDAHNDNYYPRISWLLGCWEYFKVFQLYAYVILHLLRYLKNKKKITT